MHAEHFKLNDGNWNINAVYQFIHSLADTKISTREELEEMFGYLSARHQHDSYRKGPWQSEERIYFHNSLLQKRVSEKSANVMKLNPTDFLDSELALKRQGRHWFGAVPDNNNRQFGTVPVRISNNQFLQTLDRELVNDEQAFRRGLKSGRHK